MHTVYNDQTREINIFILLNTLKFFDYQSYFWCSVCYFITFVKYFPIRIIMIYLFIIILYVEIWRSSLFIHIALWYELQYQDEHVISYFTILLMPFFIKYNLTSSYTQIFTVSKKNEDSQIYNFVQVYW